MTSEVHRITAIPRRSWDEVSAQVYSDLLTPLLRRPGGTMRLRPLQAIALHDAGVHGGLFAPVRVGGGKTLISLLVSYVMGLKRPILLVPAALEEKTRREARDLSIHWKIPFECIRIVSYELLGRVQSKDILLNHRPDGIICDEVHRLKNPKAAVTRRVSRYMKGPPENMPAHLRWDIPKFVAMSGTITKRSLKDYAHILSWCLPNQTPFPRPYNEMEEWCQALDEKVNPFSRIHPGALLTLCNAEEHAMEDEVAAARRAFRRRLGETPGVIATVEGHTGCSLRLDTITVPWRPEGTRAAVEGAFFNLRDNSITPDEWPVNDAMAVWRHTRELSLGFFYRWDPRPPKEWMVPRQIWGKFVRETLKYNRSGWDSELQVAQACASGELDSPQYQDWRAVRDTFEPNTVAVWLDDTVIGMCVEWMASHPRGIVWVEHTTFGERLAEKSGRPYFAKEGKDAQGRIIESATGPIIASIASNCTGRNLQYWHDNLLPSPPPNGLQMEQLLGRTHRDGQEADEVSATVILSCIEHLDAIERAIKDARYIEDSTGQSQKLLYADLSLPERWDVMGIPSRRFQR